MKYLSNKKYLLCIVLTISVITIAGITYSLRQTNHDAGELVILDNIADSEPIKADSLLKSFSIDRYDNERDRMFYNLLRVKIANNLHCPLTDNTVFTVAQYYSNKENSQKKCEAFYYLGKRYATDNDGPEALKSFQKALDATDGNTPKKFLSKVYNQSGCLFLSQDLYEEALEMYLKSYVCDSILKDTFNMINGLRDIGQVYKFQKKDKRCEKTLLKAYHLAQSQHSPILVKSIAIVLGALYEENGQIQEAYDIYNKNLREVESELASPAYCLAANIYDRLGKADSVCLYSEKILSVGTMPAKETALRKLLTYYSTVGDMEKVRTLLPKYYSAIDSVEDLNSQETVAKIHALYNYTQKEKEYAELRLKWKSKENTALIVALILLSLLAVFVCVSERRKKKIIEFKRLNDHLQTLYDEARVRSIRSAMSKDEGKVVTQNVIIPQANEGDAKQNILSVYDIIKESIKKRRHLYKKDWDKIYAAMEKEHPLFKEKLYHLANITDREYQICILVRLGFRNNDIATIVCRSESSVSMERTRLYRKLLQTSGTAKDFNSFIATL